MNNAIIITFIISTKEISNIKGNVLIQIMITNMGTGHRKIIVLRFIIIIIIRRNILTVTYCYLIHAGICHCLFLFIILFLLLLRSLLLLLFLLLVPFFRRKRLEGWFVRITWFTFKNNRRNLGGSLL